MAMPSSLIRLRALFLALLLTGFGGMAEASMADIEVSWQAGYTGLPAALTGSGPVLGNWRSDALQRTLGRLDSNQQVPAVLYLHGCTGFGSEGNAYRLFLTLQGYAFFAPDSLARPERRRNCDPSSHAAGLRGSTGPQRLAELRYALSQIAELPWVDHSRLFLIGFSEGAAAATRYDGDAFAGVVLTGWHCHGGADNHGLALPAGLPFLSIISAHDPWYPQLNGRTCAQFADGRPRSRSLLLSQATHVLLTSSESEAAQLSRQAILEFLDAAVAAPRPRQFRKED